jgi:hypothetical protein
LPIARRTTCVKRFAGEQPGYVQTRLADRQTGRQDRRPLSRLARASSHRRIGNARNPLERFPNCCIRLIGGRSGRRLSRRALAKSRVVKWAKRFGLQAPMPTTYSRYRYDVRCNSPEGRNKVSPARARAPRVLSVALVLSAGYRTRQSLPCAAEPALSVVEWAGAQHRGPRHARFFVFAWWGGGKRSALKKMPFVGCRKNIGQLDSDDLTERY